MPNPTSQRPDDPDAEAKALLRQAVARLADAGGGHGARADRLRESAGLAARAFEAATAGGLKDADTGTRGTNDLLAALRSLGTGAGTGVDELDALERRYRAALPELRRELGRRLKQYRGVAGLLRDAAASTAVRWSAGALVTAAIALFTAYRLTDPAYIMILEGQVFWKDLPAGRFTEEQSRHFAVTVDGAEREYAVILDPPVEVGVLRIDPVDRGDVTGVEIGRVAVTSDGGTVAREFGDLDDWSCINCRWTRNDAGAASLRPAGDDPYVVGPAFEPLRAVEIRIRMRASARKTFWEWITRVRKMDAAQE